MAKCTICGEEIALSPSASERAKKYGGSASDYTKLFTEHTKCTLEKRSTDVKALMARKREENGQAVQ